MSKKNSNATLGGMDESWRAESDLRTLIEAQVIRNDPKRFKAAQKKAKEQAEALEEAMEPQSSGDDEDAEK
jgi:hypothetical protein